ncbi:Response regulator receiver domain-containing protein [Clostridium cavendishii DSM 21758]|uniref:Stage 0 sporulation protein A homolog n=1 Tax=Clostridium cavendishii DSM 21758 TaxID=1121302 RepID=A0A1M6LSZ4_9CLOT|nr:response regulator [Clostridium cavendishii]SHJ74285.1 Response regulator receiver domain-containing protein [Clostridium cavendishii DSM 21758]
MKKIVIVDDEIYIRALIKETLEDLEEVIIFTADDGEKGIQLIEEKKPDLVLLDLVLPIYNGYEVLNHITENDLDKDMKVFLLTAKGQDKDRVTGLKLGADYYVTKPFDPEFLLQKVCEVLNLNLN